jgi:hypothetical protein
MYVRGARREWGGGYLFITHLGENQGGSLFREEKKNNNQAINQPMMYYRLSVKKSPAFINIQKTLTGFTPFFPLHLKQYFPESIKYQRTRNML